MEIDPEQLRAPKYQWEAITLAPQTVKNIHVGYLIRNHQQGSPTSWSSYSVITKIFESGDVQSFSILFEAGQFVQVARPHHRHR